MVNGSDPEWRAIKLQWKRIGDNYRWAWAYRLLTWTFRMLPDSPAGRLYTTGLYKVHRDHYDAALAEATDNKARLQRYIHLCKRND